MLNCKFLHLVLMSTLVKSSLTHNRKNTKFLKDHDLFFLMDWGFLFFTSLSIFLLCSFVCFKYSSFSFFAINSKWQKYVENNIGEVIRDSLNSKGMFPWTTVKYTVQQLLYTNIWWFSGPNQVQMQREGIKESERQETLNKGEGQCSVCRIAKAN